jgi:hypothetical protein
MNVEWLEVRAIEGDADRRTNVEWLEWMSRAKYGRMQYIDIVRGYGS